MAKKYLKISVYDAAVQRIEFLFERFENVLVAFSGGKDSSVCLNLCYDYAAANGLLDRLAMYHLDYEAQYQMTTDYVTECFDAYPGIRKFWLCLPMRAQCACRMDGAYWVPWAAADRGIWVRDIPGSEFVVSEDNCPFELREGNTDYDVQNRFGEWFAGEYGSTAIVIGLRSDESLNRWRAVTHNGSHGCDWMTGDKAYPIYDWRVDDIWTYFARTGHAYNRLYDLYYQAGQRPTEMRVASPFNDCGIHTLQLYKVIDPLNWAKLVGRVNGANFAGLYGGTTAMGWRSITLPEGHTWKSYCKFLLSTLDPETRAHYEKNLQTSIDFWREKGGALSDEAMADAARYGGVEGSKSGRSSKRVATFAEYPDDCDSTYFKELPSYKRMCVCILKNDYYCKYMGFSQTKEAVEKRKAAIEKYRNL